MERETRESGRGSANSLSAGGLGAGIAAGIGSVMLGGAAAQGEVRRWDFSTELEVLGKRCPEEEQRRERRDDFVRECELEARLSFHCGEDGEEEPIHVHTPVWDDQPADRHDDPGVFHQATLECLGDLLDSENSLLLYGATSQRGGGGTWRGRENKVGNLQVQRRRKAWQKILSAAALAGLLAAAALICLFSFSSLVAEQKEGGRAVFYLKHAHGRAAAMGGALERMRLLHAGLGGGFLDKKGLLSPGH